MRLHQLPAFRVFLLTTKNLSRTFYIVNQKIILLELVRSKRQLP